MGMHTVCSSRREDGKALSVPTVLHKFVMVTRAKLEGRYKDLLFVKNVGILKGLGLQLDFFLRFWHFPTYEDMEAENSIKESS